MESYDNRPIGVFDSGLGGLNVVTNMAKLLPNESFLYFGDTARTPYGSKSIETIIKFSVQIVDFLAENNVKMVVTACNTVSATCMDTLRERYPDIPIVGMISPVAEHLVREYAPENKIGIIGTKATVESHQYEKHIRKWGGRFDLKAKACPLFVPMIEEGVRSIQVLSPVVRYYLDEFIKENDIDVLVLGCTHYPLLRKIIQETYGQLAIVDPSLSVAQEVKKYLWNNNMLAIEGGGKSSFYASDLSDEFIQMTKELVGDGQVDLKLKNFETREQLLEKRRTGK